MTVIPSVDIRRGRCVKLIRGKPDSGRIISEDPVEVALKWVSEGAEALHLVDLDAALTGSEENLEKIAAILRSVAVPVIVGGGIRSVEKAERLMSLGARRVVVGTSAIETPQIVRDIAGALGPDRVMVAIDSKDGYVVTRGWAVTSPVKTVAAMRRFSAEKIYGFLYTDVGIEGTLCPPNLEFLSRLVRATPKPITYAGGISSLKQLMDVLRLGVEGVVVGRALYDGLFTLKEAQEALKVDRPPH